MLDAERNDVTLDVAINEVVFRLVAGDRGIAEAFLHHSRSEVTDTDSANFTLLTQGEHSFHSLLERRGFVRPMTLVEVNDVCIEAFQAALALKDD